MSLSELRTSILALLDRAGLSTQVKIREYELNAAPRLELTRATSDSVRYVRITDVSDVGGAWQFAVLFGSYGHADWNQDIDARDGGSADRVLHLVETWLVRLARWR